MYEESTNETIYESFIRRAFSIKLGGGNIIGIGEDPASMAQASSFLEMNLTSIKITTTYSLLAFNNYIDKICGEELEVKDKKRMSEMIDELLNSNRLEEILKLIKEYEENINCKYLGGLDM
ncbi:hypothetical protein [Bacillus toyonensis]|uniref:hypothetical protein n=1 Tax=Bacillus toyonensis TaxID=155322 RepID=UPI0011A47DB4|nr:hypothetical protein [Bacillus toyonensis]